MKPRPPHECGSHQPGQRACYVRCKCRCRACTDEASRWHRYHKANLTGRIDGAPILAHIERLIAAGMTVVSIAAAAGIPDHTLGNLIAGRSRSMNRATARKVLAVRRPTPPRRGYVHSIGTARRLQALAAIGWDTATLAPLLGVSRKRVEVLRRAERQMVHATVAARVATLYGELSMTPRVGWRADRSRTIAEQRGYVPPLAWDDDTIDDPAAQPYRPEPTTRADRREALIEDVGHLLAMGEPPASIAARITTERGTPYSQNDLARCLRRWGCVDLAQRIERTAA